MSDTADYLQADKPVRPRPYVHAQLRAIALFSGIGGIELGLERAGMEIVRQVENDPHARAVLSEHWPDVPQFGDIRNVDWTLHLEADLVAGGFPCQDISNAHTNGKREALNGAKSGLWSEFARCVGEIRPRWVIVENVAAWARWVPDVRADLADLGYASVPLELSAGAFGAPHRRPRAWVVAHANGQGEPLRAIHAEVARLRPVPAGSGHWRCTPPGSVRLDDGVPGGTHRRRLAGNAVVPQMAEWLGRQIIAADRVPAHSEGPR